MLKQHGKLTFSPTDLTRYMESPFASWMDRLALEHPERAPHRDGADPIMVSLAKKGLVHEEQLKLSFEKQGKQLVSIDGKCNQSRTENTLSAMQQGVDVIAQARLERDNFAGYADFLVKSPLPKNSQKASKLGSYHYEVWDSKLATTVKTGFIVQLCSYVDMLEAMQGTIAEHITVALGDGQQARLPCRDFSYYYHSLKNAFLNAQQQFNPEQAPDPAASKHWGDWSNMAEQRLIESDHLSQVANISKKQIKLLQKAGITTMQQLADMPPINESPSCTNVPSIRGLAPAVHNKLVAQALIQKKSIGEATPHYQITSPEEGEFKGMARLPPHSDSDLFFDIEGYPLDQGGLEYLWGCSYFGDFDIEGTDGVDTNDSANNKLNFIDFWAHNQKQEKAAFKDFISSAYQRWQNDPSMHIYHYGNYEIAACRKLMGRYGVCEQEMDQLLRNNVFVDLYTIVKESLLLGEPRYSIKNVERLYRPKRKTTVNNGSDSVVVYDQWRALHQAGEEGDTKETSKILNDICTYNMDDCHSTQELTHWLRKQQTKLEISYAGNTDIIETEQKEDIDERIQLRDRLLEHAEQTQHSHPEQALLIENLAWMLEFHRRESKPVFWRLFERLESSHVELIEDLDCIASCQQTTTEPFKAKPRARNLTYEYSFDLSQPFKGIQLGYYLLGIETEEGKTVRVSASLEHSSARDGLVALQSKEPPPPVLTLVPDEYINPDPIPKAITTVVAALEPDFLNNHIQQNAITDFLTRATPRIKGHTSGSPITTSSNSEERLTQITHAITQLEHSYLSIQGPPGAGKSYTAKHVIAHLVKSGARIGITSNSHKAINHLLLSTAKHCKQLNIDGYFACTKDTGEELAEADITVLTNGKLAKHTEPGCVLGTTAWGFSREDMQGQLDYLFVDEAGQVSVANLVGMSQCTENLVLLGDQMQLGQPLQGSHPAQSGLSVLDYLLQDTATIPPELGIFLDTTYRMHASINQFISHHIYNDKLIAHPSNDQRTIDVPSGYTGLLNKTAGLTFIPVEHSGNNQASDEEVDCIAKLANELLGRTLHTGLNEPKQRPIDWQDMLFVAPYNHQVNKLKSALGPKAKVGSVDQFQGQEAPIVFLSMCSSDANESARGIDFLFDKHRLNVAISRAQCLAIVVGNPALGQTSVSNIEQLKLVNLFNAIMVQ